MPPTWRRPPNVAFNWWGVAPGPRLQGFTWICSSTVRAVLLWWQSRAKTGLLGRPRRRGTVRCVGNHCGSTEILRWGRSRWAGRPIRAGSGGIFQKCHRGPFQLSSCGTPGSAGLGGDPSGADRTLYKSKKRGRGCRRDIGGSESNHVPRHCTGEDRRRIGAASGPGGQPQYPRTTGVGHARDAGGGQLFRGPDRGGSAPDGAEHGQCREPGAEVRWMQNDPELQATLSVHPFAHHHSACCQRARRSSAWRPGLWQAAVQGSGGRL